jgi:hypothetical protein
MSWLDRLTAIDKPGNSAFDAGLGRPTDDHSGDFSSLLESAIESGS